MIKQFNDAAALCSEAMQIFISEAKKAILERGKFSVVLSGGRTPNLMYDLLAKKENSSQVDWSRVFVFWGDERYVGYNSPDNNAFQARAHLLDLVPIPSENIFRIPVTGDHVADAIDYEQTIRQFFQGENPAFDLLFLGMGEEAHTASLFPGSDLITEKDKLVRDVYVEVKQMQRISFTPLLINASKHIVFMITGAEKAPAFDKVINGPFDPQQYPAQIIQPANGQITWLIGKELVS
jgi:6-phosphogluconolactonase